MSTFSYPNLRMDCGQWLLPSRSSSRTFGQGRRADRGAMVQGAVGMQLHIIRLRTPHIRSFPRLASSFDYSAHENALDIVTLSHIVHSSSNLSHATDIASRSLVSKFTHFTLQLFHPHQHCSPLRHSNKGNHGEVSRGHGRHPAASYLGPRNKHVLCLDHRVAESWPLLDSVLCGPFLRVFQTVVEES